MGKGDIKSKKGKLKNGSFGRSRNRRVLKAKNKTSAKSA
jgi:ribosomal small subunit protein bTHX